MSVSSPTFNLTFMPTVFICSKLELFGRRVDQCDSPFGEFESLSDPLRFAIHEVLGCQWR
jgi:hypothetical protein